MAAAASGEKMPTANLQAVVDKIAPAIAKVKGDRKTPGVCARRRKPCFFERAVDLSANSPYHFARERRP